MSSQLRTIHLVGPRLADTNAKEPQFTWTAELAVSFLGRGRDDKSLVNSTQGLRVILQSPEPSWINIQGNTSVDVKLLAPQLLAANAYARQYINDNDELVTAKLEFADQYNKGGYKLRATVPENDSEKGKITRGVSSLLLTPLEPWPSTQKTKEIEIPRFRLAEGRLRVLVSAEGGTAKLPYGFLRLVPLSDGKRVAAFVATSRSEQSLLEFPYLELPVVPVTGKDAKWGPFVSVDLTPDGLEFRGTVANPIKAFDSSESADRIHVLLRLVHQINPLDRSKTVWSLELVREEKTNFVQQALAKIRSAFAVTQGNPVLLNIDNQSEIPKVRWPLSLEKNTLVLSGKEDWHLWLDVSSITARLLGTPVRGGQLPTVVQLSPEFMEIIGSNKDKNTDETVTLKLIDNRSEKQTTIEYIKGPCVNLNWQPVSADQPKPATISVEITEAQKQEVQWHLDKDQLGRTLVERYQRAGVHPAGNPTTYAFLPLKDGWLQLPIDVPRAEDCKDQQSQSGVPAYLDGTLEFKLDNPMQDDSAQGRRLTLYAAESVLATATFKKGTLASVAVSLYGAAGTADGLLWMAAGSPSAENVLPELDSGSAALMGPALGFGRSSVPEEHRIKLTSTAFHPGNPWSLTLAPDSKTEAEGFLWHAYTELPLITAVGITRTAEGSGKPSATRGLLCRKIDLSSYALTLSYGKDHGIPQLQLKKESSLLEPYELPLADHLDKIPLVPLTLPGIEFQPDSKKFEELKVRLRFDLPVLDELFANTHLAEKSTVSASGTEHTQAPVSDNPTALDPHRLMAVWQQMVDRLDLSRVQASLAFDFCPQQASTVKINELFAEATWSVEFNFEALTEINGKDYAFGKYQLGKNGSWFSGTKALKGLTSQFNVDRLELKELAGAKNPLEVVGFATALWKDKFDNSEVWRDARGALTESMPRTENFAGDLHGLVYRKAGVVGKTGIWRATIATPIAVESPMGSEARKLGLWFRDLPLERAGNELSFNPDLSAMETAIGPMQSAFDKERLPYSIYEWRFCNDIENGAASSGVPPSAYDFAIGPFQFRPLRLLNLTLETDVGTKKRWAASSAQVIGTLSLPINSDQAEEPGPFGVENDYATGNLVAISLTKKGDGLTFAGAKWDGVKVNQSEAPPVQLSTIPLMLRFRISRVSVFLKTHTNASPDRQPQTTVSLQLILQQKAKENGLPTVASVTLKTILFGRHIHLENGELEAADSDEFNVTFTILAPSTKSSGVILEKVKVNWSSTRTGQPCYLIVEGTLNVFAIDPPDVNETTAKPIPVLFYPLGGSLWWLNQEIKNDNLTTTIDHQRGLLDISVDWSPKAKTGTDAGVPETDTEFDIQPIAGFTCKNPTIRSRFMLAIKSDMDTTVEKKPDVEPVFFASDSGFGEFLLISTEGPTKRFNHVLRGDGKSWLSKIVVDLSLAKYESRIHWPIRSLPDKLTFTTDIKEIESDLGTLAARVCGRVNKGAITAYEAEKTLKHLITLTVTGQLISTRLLKVKEDEKIARVRLASPWTFHALVHHYLSGEERSLSWTTLDHVSAVDACSLAETAKTEVNLPKPLESGIFAFAARYKSVGSDEQQLDSHVIKAGLVLRAFAQAGFPVEAIAQGLKENLFDNEGKLKTKIRNGIFIVGAGPTVVKTQDAKENPFWPDKTSDPNSSYLTEDTQGVALALPWLTAIDAEYDYDHELFAGFKQAPETNKAEWYAPDIDWATGSPMPLVRKPAPVYSVGGGSADEMAKLLANAMLNGPDDKDISALSAVEQLFLHSSRAVGDITQRPIWLRSLLALRTVWDSFAQQRSSVINDQVTMITPSGQSDGLVARFKLGLSQDATNPQDTPLTTSRSGHLIAIGRYDTAPPQRLPDNEIPMVGRDASGCRRLVARAEHLVKEPLVLLVITDRLSMDNAANIIWISIDVPPDLDDASLDIPMEISAEDRLYASPALGWPTKNGTQLAASGALGMGEDRPFQDRSPEVTQEKEPDDIKSYGSGLSGRAASLSLPARAMVGPETPDNNPQIDVSAPVFIAMGRKTIFERPDEDVLPITTPPARNLSPTEARVVVPIQEALATALSRVIKGHAAPIVPPYMERMSFGLRPGAMQAEFDMLIFSEKQADAKNENMDSDFERFGRPGHVGPRLLRQQRPPRAPAFPKVPIEFVERHGRRTFVSVDDHDGRFPTPFLLLNGAATVLRRRNSSTTCDESYRIAVLELPLLSDWGGSIILCISSPSYKTPSSGLNKALAQLGLLSKGMTACISIDRFVIPFTNASWRQANDTIELTISVAEQDKGGIYALFEAVDGDSEVMLQIRCAHEGDDNQNPPVQNLSFPILAYSYLFNLCDIKNVASLVTKLTTDQDPQTKSISDFIWEKFGPTTQQSLIETSENLSQRQSILLKALNELLSVNVYDETRFNNIPLRSETNALISQTPRGEDLIRLNRLLLEDVYQIPSLESETRHQFALRIPVRPMGRPSLTIYTTTLVFADPSYDRELSGTGSCDLQRDNSGIVWKLALDRFEYGTDTPIYFAFGPIDPKSGKFDNQTPTDIILTLHRQPTVKYKGTKPNVEDLSINGVTSNHISPKEAYGVTLDKLVGKGGGAVTFDDGDQIVLNVGFKTPDGSNGSLTVRATIISRPIIAPPPAVYSLIVSDGDTKSRVQLYATGPLPQRIEFPKLIDDLATGYVRRRALFIWTISDINTFTNKEVTLVKIDRSGGGQIDVVPNRIMFGD